jgi:hypothetical protein
MTERNERTEPKRPGGAAKKTYTKPTLTEYGSVAKLTMAKGSTLVEPPGQLKKQCL